MKKILITLIAFGIAVSGYAQSYRGFIDIFGGTGLGGAKTIQKNGAEITGIKIPGVVGLNTSHGCQIIPCLYTGLGAGVLIPFDSNDSFYSGNVQSSGMYVPLFFDIRYDLDVRKKVTPFIDIKIGYQMGINFDNHPTTSLEGYQYLKFNPSSGLYFQPMVGLRFKMGSRSGFNLGVAYDTTIKESFYGTPYEGVEEELLGDIKIGALMLNLGFDF